VTGYTLDDYIGKVVVIHEGADKVACGIITAAPALKVELNLFGLGNDDFTYHIHEGGSWILQKQHWSAMVISNPDLSTLYLFVSLCFSLFLFVSLCVSLFLLVSLCVSLFLFVSLCFSLCLFVSLYLCSFSGTCTPPADNSVNGHWYDTTALQVDPWNTVPLTPVSGKYTNVDTLCTGYDLNNGGGLVQPRTIVFYDNTGARAGCVKLSKEKDVGGDHIDGRLQLSFVANACFNACCNACCNACVNTGTLPF
jgi:hypothetical protein